MVYNSVVKSYICCDFSITYMQITHHDKYLPCNIGHTINTISDAMGKPLNTRKRRGVQPFWRWCLRAQHYSCTTTCRIPTTTWQKRGTPQQDAQITHCWWIHVPEPQTAWFFQEGWKLNLSPGPYFQNLQRETDFSSVFHFTPEMTPPPSSLWRCYPLAQVPFTIICCQYKSQWLKLCIYFM